MDAANNETVNGAGPRETIDMTGERVEVLDRAEVESGPALDRFWKAIRRFPNYVRLTANMARDPNVPASAKALLAVGGIYTVSPVDLVPGIIPVAGQLDDMVVLLLALRTAIRACPPEVAAAHLERAGLTKADFDTDLAAAKDTARWLAKRGYRASRSFASWGGQRISALWRSRLSPR
jgi:uncharacterized membrane protein YkvA (DUF1232 family)